MKQRLLFLGPPGAGKGTQAQRLSASQGLLHLSTGDLLRAEIQAGSDLGQQVEAVMASGALVSDDLVLAIVRNRLQHHSQGWLLDGFPRNLPQALALEQLLVELGQQIEQVVLLEIDDGLLIGRLLSRGRTDDNEQVIRHRLEVYRQQTAPLISYYRDLGLLVSVEAAGNVAEVGDRISAVLVD